MLWHLWGPEKLKAWHADWRRRGVQEVAGNAQVKNLVAEGVCDLGWTDTDDYFEALDAGKHVAALPVRVDGGRTICIPNTVAIVKGARHQAEARRLVDYLLSAQTEVALANSEARQVPRGAGGRGGAAGAGAGAGRVGAGRHIALGPRPGPRRLPGLAERGIRAVTLGSQYGWALCRGAVVAALAVLAGMRLSALLAGRGGRARRLLWAAVLLPFLTPALLVGYGWSNFSLSLVRHPAANELLYDALVLAKLAPVAAFVLYFAPAFLSPQAVHCRRLLRRRESGARALAAYAAFLARGPLRAGMVAFGLVFLLAFGEFEIASLMGVRTWTVGLFDAHAGGLALAESLRLAALPALTELALLVLLLVALFRARGTPQGGGARRRPGGAARALTWCYVGAALLLVTLVPGCIVLRGTWEGLRVLVERFAMGKDILASALFGAAGAACAYAAAGWFVGRALGRVRLGVAFAALRAGHAGRARALAGDGLGLPAHRLARGV